MDSGANPVGGWPKVRRLEPGPTVQCETMFLSCPRPAAYEIRNSAGKPFLLCEYHAGPYIGNPIPDRRV